MITLSKEELNQLLGLAAWSARIVRDDRFSPEKRAVALQLLEYIQEGDVDSFIELANMPAKEFGIK